MTSSDRETHVNPFASGDIARSYEDWFDTPLGAVVDRLEKDLIARLAQPKPGERALDVGTGTGHFARWLADLGLHVIGLDSSEAMLQSAPHDGRIEWKLGDAAALQWADATFDLVLCVTALEFMADPTSALDEMYRVVRPGGRMVVAVLNRESLFGQAYIAQARQMDTPFRHARFYTVYRLLDSLRPYGGVRWGASVFFPPTLAQIRTAKWREWVGRALPCVRRHGALLVGRVDK
jgi:ubiquinone/menaquinone biosynthesis C-methylase UbiE